jgi:uncharacterized protein YqgV (UPF0045/DUF77 family)
MMTADYTQSEIELLLTAMTVASCPIVFANSSLVSFVQEMIDTIKFNDEIRFKYQHNELIASLIARFNLIAREQLKAKANQVLELPLKIDSNLSIWDKNIEQYLGIIKAAAEAIDKKASPQIAKEFKQFLYEIAEKTANAAKEGAFGWGGLEPKISNTEAALLQRMKQELALP